MGPNHRYQSCTANDKQYPLATTAVAASLLLLAREHSVAEAGSDIRVTVMYHRTSPTTPGLSASKGTHRANAPPDLVYRGLHDVSACRVHPMLLHPTRCGTSRFPIRYIGAVRVDRTSDRDQHLRIDSTFNSVEALKKPCIEGLELVQCGNHDRLLPGWSVFCQRHRRPIACFGLDALS